MLRWLSEKVPHHTPVSVPDSARRNKTASAKGDEEFAYYPGFVKDDIEVTELDIKEFLRQFKK